MKQGKRNKTATDAVAGKASEASVAAVSNVELPDAAYVDQLLAASAPVAAEALPIAVAVADDVSVESVDVAVAANEEVAMQTGTESAESNVADDGVLRLPVQCLLRDAVEYRQRLLDCVYAETVLIDVAAVERIDTAFMQVLLAFARSRSDSGEKITWLNINPVFTEATQILGLRAEMALPDVGVAA